MFACLVGIPVVAFGAAGCLSDNSKLDETPSHEFCSSGDCADCEEWVSDLRSCCDEVKAAVDAGTTDFYWSQDAEAYCSVDTFDYNWPPACQGAYTDCDGVEIGIDSYEEACEEWETRLMWSGTCEELLGEIWGA